MQEEYDYIHYPGEYDEVDTDTTASGYKRMKDKIERDYNQDPTKVMSPNYEPKISK